MREPVSSVSISCFLYVVYTYSASIFWAIETVGFLGLWLVISVLVLAPFTAVFCGYLWVIEWQKNNDHRRDIEWRKAQIDELKIVTEAQKKTPVLAGGERPKLSTNSPILLADNSPKIKRGNEWLDKFCLPQNNAHFLVAGPSRSAGKTTLLHYLTHRIQQPHPSAEYYIFDPHHNQKKEPEKWFTPPVFSSASDADLYAQIMQNKLEKRKQNDDINTCIFIADELGSYKDSDFKHAAIRVMEEGAKFGLHVVMSGHGITGKVNGFAVENLGNCGLLALDKVASSLINHASFPLRHDREMKKIFLSQLVELAGRNDGLELTDPTRTRYGLAVPSSGLPFVFETPFIDTKKLQFNQLADINNIFLAPAVDDYSIVKSRLDEIEFHPDGSINKSSVSRILNLEPSGSGFRKTDSVVALLLQNGDV